MWKFLASELPELDSGPDPPPPDVVAKVTECRRCERCRALYSHEDSAILHKHTCYSCESKWVENGLYRLVDRLGRKAALLALKRLLS